MSTAVSSGGRGVSRATSPWLKLFSLVLMLTGVIFLALYLVYLPMPQWFISEAALEQIGILDPGMVFYSLATGGAVFMVWGRLLMQLDGNGVSRSDLLQASALGMLLLSVMRVGTTLFPHGPFVQMLALPLGECLLFAFIAWRLFKAA